MCVTEKNKGKFEIPVRNISNIRGLKTIYCQEEGRNRRNQNEKNKKKSNWNKKRKCQCVCARACGC